MSLGRSVRILSQSLGQMTHNASTIPEEKKMTQICSIEHPEMEGNFPHPVSHEDASHISFPSETVLIHLFFD